MDPARIFAELEALAGRLGIAVRVESFSEEQLGEHTGFCRVRGRPIVFIDGSQSVEARTRALAQALSSCELDGVFVRPVLRRLIERTRTCARQ